MYHVSPPTTICFISSTEKHGVINVASSIMSDMALIQAVVDALDDLGIPTPLTADSRGYASVGSGDIAVDIAQRLIAILHVEGGIGTVMASANDCWVDIKPVCEAMGFPTVEEQEGGGSYSIDECLEMIMFLASQVQSSRLLRSRKEYASKSSSKTTEARLSEVVKTPSLTSIDVLNRLLASFPEGEEVTNSELESVLGMAWPSLSEAQLANAVACNRVLAADYEMRTTLLLQKHKATVAAFARSRGLAALGPKDAGSRDNGMEHEIIRRIAAEIRSPPASAASSETSGGGGRDSPLRQFILPSTESFRISKQKQVMRGGTVAHDRGGRLHEDDRNMMPAWQKTRKEGPSPSAKSGIRRGGKRGSAKKKEKGSKEGQNKKGGTQVPAHKDVGDEGEKLPSTPTSVAKNNQSPFALPRNRSGGGSGGGRSGGSCDVSREGGNPQATGDAHGASEQSRASEEVTAREKPPVTPGSPARKGKRRSRSKRKSGRKGKKDPNM